MARKTPAPVTTAADPIPEIAPVGTSACTVTRLPGAPPRRAGRTWPAGEEVGATLTPAEIAAIAADPGYTIDVGGVA